MKKQKAKPNPFSVTKTKRQSKEKMHLKRYKQKTRRKK